MTSHNKPKPENWESLVRSARGASPPELDARRNIREAIARERMAAQRQQAEGGVWAWEDAIIEWFSGKRARILFATTAAAMALLIASTFTVHTGDGSANGAAASQDSLVNFLESSDLEDIL